MDRLPEASRRKPPRDSLTWCLWEGPIRHWGLCFCSTIRIGKGCIPA